MTLLRSLGVQVLMCRLGKPLRKRKRTTGAPVWGSSSRVNVRRRVFPSLAAQLTIAVCQLHGGDIGVSSKAGEGSTFGFYFKVRRPMDSSGEGRPPYSTRSSDSSNAPQRSQTPRPSYSRANSNLKRIKELENDPGAPDHVKKDGKQEGKQNPKRPPMKTLSSSAGVNSEEMGMNESIRNPPTEYHPEAHPEAVRDQRYEETAQAVESVEGRRSSFSQLIEDRLPDLSLGETTRQALHSKDRSEADRKDQSDSRSTLLLVEDNLINQKVLRRQLQGKGFEVGNPKRALCVRSALTRAGLCREQRPGSRRRSP
jgi:hypothetical protein